MFVRIRLRTDALREARMFQLEQPLSLEEQIVKREREHKAKCEC
jgi:DNA-binding protein H-NS